MECEPNDSLMRYSDDGWERYISERRRMLNVLSTFEYSHR